MKKDKRKSKGFTLIELLAVIVILGVLMLVAIPAVSRYIDESKKRSYVTTVKNLAETVRYGVVSGNSEYEVKDGETRKFYFNDIETEKGKNTNMYGYVEVTKKGDKYIYKVFSGGSSNQNNSYCNIGSPINVDDLTIDRLQSCVRIDYVVGDIISYKEADWIIIKNSIVDEDYVALMKKNALTASDLGDYAREETCSYYTVTNGYYGCTSNGQIVKVNEMVYGTNNNYNNSNIKVVLNNYVINNNMTNDLKEVDSYNIRLITYDELMGNLGYDPDHSSGGLRVSFEATENTPTWVYRDFESTAYWIMPHQNDNSSIVIYNIRTDGNLDPVNATFSSAVRPVINLKKSVIENS